MYTAEPVLPSHGGYQMNKSWNDTARQTCDLAFSSMSFGGVFGAWLVLTILIAIKKGQTTAMYSVAIYLALWLAVAAAGWLLEFKSKHSK